MYLKQLGFEDYRLIDCTMIEGAVFPSRCWAPFQLLVFTNLGFRFAGKRSSRVSWGYDYCNLQQYNMPVVREAVARVVYDYLLSTHKLNLLQLTRLPTSTNVRLSITSETAIRHMLTHLLISRNLPLVY